MDLSFIKCIFPEPPFPCLKHVIYAVLQFRVFFFLLFGCCWLVGWWLFALFGLSVLFLRLVNSDTCSQKKGALESAWGT